MPRVFFKQTITRGDLANRIGRASFGRFDRIGRLIVAAAKADVSTPVTPTTLAVGTKVAGRTVRRGKRRGPFRGKRILGSRVGEFPRRETGELFGSVRHKVKLRFSLNSPLVLVVFSTAKHGRHLETKAPRDGGRKWLSRTIRRLLPRIRSSL